MNCIGGIQGLNGLGPWRLSLNGRRPETPPHIMNTHTIRTAHTVHNQYTPGCTTSGRAGGLRVQPGPYTKRRLR